MRIRRSLCFWIFIFTVLCGNPINAQQQTTVTLTADDLMRIVAENWEKNELLKSELISFERRHIEHELYRNENPKSVIKDETSYHGKLYPPELRGNNGGLSVNFNAILSLSYDYVFLDPNSSDYTNLPAKYKLDCGDCYVIKFEPKSALPNISEIAPSGASAIEKGIHETATRMEGIIFVDKLHLFIRKYTGELGNSFDKGKLSSIRIITASLDLEQDLRPELSNVVVLKSAEIMYQVRVAWLRYRTRKDVWQWSDYRLNEQTVQ